MVVHGVLAFLRTIIGTGVAFVVSYILVTAVGAPGSFVGAYGYVVYLKACGR